MSIQHDGNWNSEDYITIFWHGSEGVVKTRLEKGFKWRIYPHYPVPNGSHILNSSQDKIIGPGQCPTVQVFVVQLCDFSDVVCNMTMHTCHLWLTCTTLVKCQLHFKGHLSMVICSTQRLLELPLTSHHYDQAAVKKGMHTFSGMHNESGSHIDTLAWTRQFFSSPKLKP